jgi:hypothetical protein
MGEQKVLIEYFTGYEHGGTTLAMAPQHEGCGFESRRIGDPLNWCGPVTTPTRPDVGNHGAYVLRQRVGRDGNTYYGIGKPTDKAIPSGGFASNPLYMSFFYRHNRTMNDFAPWLTYGVWGVGTSDLRYCELRIQHQLGARTFVLYDSDGLNVAVGSATINPNVWYWIKVVVFKGIYPEDSYVKVYVNDVLDIDYGSAHIGVFRSPRCFMGGRWDLAGGHGGLSFDEYYDDAVIGSSWMPNDQHHVVYMTPNADGTHSDHWATWSYMEVDERPHDGDVTIVGPAEGFREGAWWTCHVEPCSTAGESTGITPRIFAVRNMTISKDGGFGSSNCSKIRLKLGDDLLDSPAYRQLFFSYVGQTRVFQNNPWNSYPWTTGMLDDLEVGTLVRDEEGYWLTQAGIHVLFGDRGPSPVDSQVNRNFGR